MPFWAYLFVMLTAFVAGFGCGYVVRQSEETERLVRAYTQQWFDPLPCENGPGHCTVDLDRLRGTR